jgi:hypothetical protein
VIRFDLAVVLGKQGGAREGAGRPKKGAIKNQPDNVSLKYGTADHWIARLDRDGHGELAAKEGRNKKSSF